MGPLQFTGPCGAADVSAKLFWFLFFFSTTKKEQDTEFTQFSGVRTPKIYAGSGLPEGPFWKTISAPLKLGKKWVLVNIPKWV